jgi:KaiC/GvpD/RAD55 family RecA-like ATPase
MIVSIKEILNTLNQVRTGEYKEGLKTGIDELDKHFRFKRQFSVILGHSNVGKTQTMLYLMFLYT